jgi:hypothetical protein
VDCGGPCVRGERGSGVFSICVRRHFFLIEYRRRRSYPRHAEFFKNLTEGNKRKEPKIKILTHELLASTLLSNASSLVIHQSFKSHFTYSSNIKFGRPLALFLLTIHLITPLRIGASPGLRYICPNHLKRCCTSFSSTGATPSLSRISSFRT